MLLWKLLISDAYYHLRLGAEVEFLGIRGAAVADLELVKHVEVVLALEFVVSGFAVVVVEHVLELFEGV